MKPVLQKGEKIMKKIVLCFRCEEKTLGRGRREIRKDFMTRVKLSSSCHEDNKILKLGSLIWLQFGSE